MVTPRRGKAVEINALWYNALRLLEQLAARETGDDARADEYRRASPTRARESFNRRFWYEEGGYLYDVVDGETAATIPPAGPTRSCHFARSSGARRIALAAGAGRGDGAAADAGGLAVAGARASRLQAAVLRRPAVARRRLSPGHGLGLADRPVHRCLAEGASRRQSRGPPIPRRVSRPTSARRASARSARSSTPSRRSRRAAASPRPGAWPRCCAAG